MKLQRYMNTATHDIIPDLQQRERACSLPSPPTFRPFANDIKQLVQRPFGVTVSSTSIPCLQRSLSYQTPSQAYPLTALHVFPLQRRTIRRCSFSRREIRHASAIAVSRAATSADSAAGAEAVFDRRQDQAEEETSPSQCKVRARE